MSATQLPRHVVIVGAGLAGPALAIALARQSIRSTILERRPTMEDIGGVIFLAPNAMKVMNDVLHVGDQIRQRAYPVEKIHIHVQSGDQLHHAGGFHVAQHGVQGASIGRPTLHSILVDECKSMRDMVQVRYDARLETIEETDEGVAAVLEGGERITGDVLIGADGIGSRVRKFILGDRDPKPVYSGVLMLGAVVPSSSVNIPSTVQFPSFLYHRHGAFLTFGMDPDGKYLQWATSLEMPERERKSGWREYQESNDAIRDLRAQYADTTVQPIRSFVDNITNEDLKLWAPYTVPDLPTWHTKRVCLVGDAVHAFPPAMGQGSAQAFEDIALLSRLLSSDLAVAQGYDRLFGQYERTRRSRVDMIRKATFNAEASRRKTSNALYWWLKAVGVRAALWAFGKNGYLNGSSVVGYDVTKEDISAIC